MSVTPVAPITHVDFQKRTEQSLTDRIRMLAAQGLKIRDISSLLHIHPLIVIRVLGGQK
ncbi:hypothetical protein [Peristeroidobacter agariperforans]|uniref:hypothetical protein n=1 Tax=Peristeroidobacter agariperforans TaxID=268404 RepID=UPI001300647F|nr:hypothetical protein [Peristeroidobacter agariperforans]